MKPRAIETTSRSFEWHIYTCDLVCQPATAFANALTQVTWLKWFRHPTSIGVGLDNDGRPDDP
jgi:hypothetical protein